ncbi:MAG: EAL domain-containing protein [Lachnospiraceae bacterium]|nr:EAL domain-containing protein [Lachnospiraceae bacterium]
MDVKKGNGNKNRILDRTLERLANRRKVPIYVLVVLLLIYFASALIISLTAGSQKVVMFGGNPLYIYTLAGVFSSVANLCIVLMVIFCGKPGFIASITVLLVQIPMMIIGIINGTLSSMPGLFSNALTFIVVLVIYVNNRKVEEYQQRMQEQATTDVLTGLPNGFASTELLDEMVRHNKPFASVAIDVNNFKSINDTMGFDMGNKVLIEIASRCRKIADEGLSGTLDFISRINGDEYSLIIRNYDSIEAVEKTIKKYESALEEKMLIDGYELFINACFGYAVFPEDSTDRNTMINYSVAAMKEVKRINSSEHIMHFTPELLKDQKSLVIDNKVRFALENDMIGFNLQPQYDISHKLRGFEALARMKDSEGNVISPAEFIPAAERLGMIDSLDLMVYRKSAMFIGELIRKTGSGIILSINASVKHLMKSGFSEEIHSLLKDSGIPAKQLEIEITESILIESAEKAADCLNKLKNMGIRIAIDDFGTGYSSLSYLNSFPSDILKIDKSFIDKMNDSDSSKKYVEAIISLAHVLDLEVIAEGVEEQEQLETLRNIHCDHIQGFIWGKPLPQNEAEALLMGGSL